MFHLHLVRTVPQKVLFYDLTNCIIRRRVKSDDEKTETPNQHSQPTASPQQPKNVTSPVKEEQSIDAKKEEQRILTQQTLSSILQYAEKLTTTPTPSPQTITRAPSTPGFTPPQLPQNVTPATALSAVTPTASPSSGTTLPSSPNVPYVSPERLAVIQDLLKLSSQTDKTATPKQISNDPRHNNWSKRQKIAWLHCYHTEPDQHEKLDTDSRWVAFSKRMKEEFDVVKDNVKCQKQVIYIHTHITSSVISTFLTLMHVFIHGLQIFLCVHCRGCKCVGDLPNSSNVQAHLGSYLMLIR